MITGPQIRAARALIGLDQKALAEHAGVSLATVRRMEASEGDVRGVAESLLKVLAALRAEGIEMIGDLERSNGGGRGVRLVHPSGLTGRTH
jgi:transcriptional regulator with XRE-family HTH domain